MKVMVARRLSNHHFIFALISIRELINTNTASINPFLSIKFRVLKVLQLPFNPHEYSYLGCFSPLIISFLPLQSQLLPPLIRINDPHLFIPCFSLDITPAAKNAAKNYGQSNCSRNDHDHQLLKFRVFLLPTNKFELQALHRGRRVRTKLLFIITRV